jgi:tRNA (guanosine-2'-O-)-methyltransferase
MDNDLIAYLENFVTKKRKQTFEKILEKRTRYITVVLEDIYQPHNASAVLRTCECFGIQDIHIIENKNEYNINPDVVVGSHKWLSLFKYNTSDENSIATVRHLKENGYRIVATIPDQKSTELKDFDLNSGKVALLFGTELKGLTDDILNVSDEFLHIPMAGFTQSLNISVSAAIILYELTKKLRQSDIPWGLMEEEKQLLKTEWLKNTIKNADMLIHNFKEQNKSPENL